MKIIDRDLHLGLSSGNYIETKTITPISPAVTAATSPSKVKKARPYTLAQKSFTAAELVIEITYGFLEGMHGFKNQSQQS